VIHSFKKALRTFESDADLWDHKEKQELIKEDGTLATIEKNALIFGAYDEKVDNNELSEMSDNETAS